MEALVKFLAEHDGECLMAMDEAKRFMKMLMGEYSGGKESSAREMFMELLVRLHLSLPLPPTRSATRLAHSLALPARHRPPAGTRATTNDSA